MPHVPREPEEFELEFTREAVCPYCGYVESESYDVFTDAEFDGCEAVIPCGGCDKEYEVVLNIEYSYTTKKQEA